MLLQYLREPTLMDFGSALLMSSALQWEMTLKYGIYQ